MRIKNLLMLVAFLVMSGVAMAQTELTASRVKVVPGWKGELSLNLKSEIEVGGWQLFLVMPEGISLAGESGKLEIGSEPTEGWPDATFFNDVALTRGKDNHLVIGCIDENKTLVVCVPSAKQAKISGTSGELCKIKLSADNSFEGTKTCQIKGFIAADSNGENTYEAADISFNIIQLKCNLTDDGVVDVADLQTLINYITGAVPTPSDFKGFNTEEDDIVDVSDLQMLINEIVL